MLRDDFVTYMESWATAFGAPLREGVEATSVRKTGDRLEVVTNQGVYRADKVVIATATHQRPRLPPNLGVLPKAINQLLATGYRNPEALADGAVLVVGSGQTPEVPVIRQLDISAAGITTVIWATGFQFDFSWIDAPVFDSAGYPVTDRGVTAMPGLYFTGLNWMHKRKSGILFGVNEDAAYLARRIVGT